MMSGVTPPCPVSFTRAPAASRMRADSASPCWAANIKRVEPPLDLAWMSARRRSNSSTTEACRSEIAHISAVWPPFDSFALALAPRASRRRTTAILPAARRFHERSFPGEERRIGISFGVEQFCGDGFVGVGCGNIERGRAIVVLGVHIRAGFQENFDHLCIVARRRPEQRGRSVGLRDIHVGPTAKQRLNRGAVARLR